MTSDRHPNMSLNSLTIAARLALAPQLASATPAPQAPVPDAFATMAQTLARPETKGEEGRDTAAKADVSADSCAGEDCTDSVGAVETTDPAPKSFEGSSLEERLVAKKIRELREVMGERIRQAREFNGVPQGEFAAWLGYANSTQPSLWEKGARLPPVHELPRICRTLGVSADFVLGVSEEPEHDVGESRRALLVGHLRDQLEAVAGHLADVALESGSEVEAALRASKLLTKCEAVQATMARFKAANRDVFDDLPAGALLVRVATELAEAAGTVAAQLDAVNTRRRRAAVLAKDAVAVSSR